MIPCNNNFCLSNRARRLKRKEGLDLIVIDYIQLMKSSGIEMAAEF